MASTSSQKTSRILWRRARAAKTREDRTVNEYIKIKHPEIYQEAVDFYDKLNAKYPYKGDLRKLSEFYKLSADMRKAKSYTDNMVLRIPLLACDKPVEDTPVEDTPTVEDTPVEDTPTVEDTPVEDTPTVEDTPVEDTTAAFVQLGPIDNDVIDKIVAELQGDADICNFFESMDVDQLTPLEEELLMY